MLNRKRNFEIRVYLDKIMRMHQNYLFFNKEIDFLFKKICNYSSANSIISSNQWSKADVEHEISKVILKCSVCDQRVHHF